MFVKSRKLLFMLMVFFLLKNSSAQKIMNVADGWAKNSVNTVVFRKNAITSFNGIQFVSFYDEESNVVIAKGNPLIDAQE